MVMKSLKEPGSVGPLTLPTLIQGLCGERETGTLVLKDDAIERTLYFDTGRVVFATSNDPDDRLGQLLFRHGMISLTTLKEAAAVSSFHGKRMGTVLVGMMAIRPQDLIWGVTEQVKQMVLSLFQWTRGCYTFEAGPLPSEEVITLKMPTPDLVMAGIKSIDAWSRIEAAVGDLETRYQPSSRLQELSKELTLSLDEWTLLSRCESGATLGQICEVSPANDFEVCRLIWAFMVTGLLLKQEAAQAGTIS
ncbi:MAG TPA: DUF4388 domain-containing protein [Candidatus Polarisedimenticolia bacterium]|jgi:hypothetical protein